MMMKIGIKKSAKKADSNTGNVMKKMGVTAKTIPPVGGGENKKKKDTYGRGGARKMNMF